MRNRFSAASWAARLTGFTRPSGEAAVTAAFACPSLSAARPCAQNLLVRPGSEVTREINKDLTKIPVREIEKHIFV
jgi:hypothetical protein